MPGGCNLGLRPVDLHLKGLRAMGARIDFEQGYVRAQGPLHGEEIFLAGPFGPTVLGTANVMMAAVLTDGRTVIEGAACEPEVSDLANFLIACGAHIEGVGSPHIVIKGVERLEGVTWRVIPDRMEAMNEVVVLDVVVVVRNELAVERRLVDEQRHPHEQRCEQRIHSGGPVFQTRRTG